MAGLKLDLPPKDPFDSYTTCQRRENNSQIRNDFGSQRKSYMENESQDAELIDLVRTTRKLASQKASHEHLAEHPELSTGRSRYKTEFQELEKLGSGGYGQVFKCQNKLDKREYAIKKIFLNETADREKILREVQALSILQHQHIVRYYQAWIEEGNWVEEEISLMMKVDSEESDLSSDTYVAILFIQMELCHRTLKDVLSRGLHHDTAWRYFRQIVEGLQHVHESGIIHRDLSRRNIFLDRRDNIKIGDFGLALFFTTSGGSPTTSGTGYVGNAIYRAPEMSDERPRINCKVDIYSLGVILVELLHFIDTEYERIYILEDLKKGIYPSSITTDDEISLISSLISLSPCDRPSTTCVLDKVDRIRSTDYVGHAIRQFVARDDSNASGSKQNFQLL